MDTATHKMTVRVFIAASPPSEAVCQSLQFVRVSLQVLGNRIVDEVPSALLIGRKK
jgi:hypothetical protein